MRDAIRKDRNQGIGIALAVILLSTYVAFFLGTVLTKPLARLVEATRQIAAGRMDHRVTISSSDEIGLLAESFNRMADALQARQEEIASSYEELELTNEEIRTAYEQLENSQRELGQKNVSLKESEERYRNLVDSASEAILVLDASYGAILEANPETERLTGHGRDALMKMRLSDLLHASNPDEIVDAVRRSAAAGQERSTAGLWSRRTAGRDLLHQRRRHPARGSAGPLGRRAGPHGPEGDGTAARPDGEALGPGRDDLGRRPRDQQPPHGDPGIFRALLENEEVPAAACRLGSSITKPTG
jgi:PAS domain S-box-containing protein